MSARPAGAVYCKAACHDVNRRRNDYRDASNVEATENGERSFEDRRRLDWLPQRRSLRPFRVSVLRLLPPGAPQKFVNSKTNDVEDAYRQLLAARARQIVASSSCRPKRHASPTNSSPTNTLRTGGSLKHRSLGTSTSFSPR